MSLFIGYNNDVFGDNLFEQEPRKGLYKPFGLKNNFGRQSYPIERMGEVYNFNQPIAQKYESILGLPFSAWSAARLLSDSYTGPCMRVRRSTDNALIDIFFNTNNELDTDALLGFLGNASGFVSILYDQSGRGNHFTQTTAGSQPRIVNAGVVDTVNGKPSLRFTSANSMSVLSSTATYKWLHDTDDANFCQYVFIVSRNETGQFIYLASNSTTTGQTGFCINSEDSFTVSNTRGLTVLCSRSVLGIANAVYLQYPSTSLILDIGRLNVISHQSLRTATAANRSIFNFNNSSISQTNTATSPTSNSNASTNLIMGGNAGPGTAFMTEVILYRTTQTEYTNTYDINQDLVNYYQTALVRPLDGDAEAFINAAGITDATQISAINTLVISLKNQGLWTKCLAIYPFVGGTATSHQYNLKNPANTSAAFRLSFVGGWTHSSNGALPNGTNAFANTFYNFNTQTTVNNAFFGAYIRTDNTSGLQVYGAFSGGGNRAFNNLSNGNIQIASNDLINYTPSPSTGFFFSRRENSTFNESYRNGVSLGTTTALTTSLPVVNFYFAALSNAGTISFYSLHEIAFGVLGGSASMTNTDASNLYSTIQTFQTALGRQV